MFHHALRPLVELYSNHSRRAGSEHRLVLAQLEVCMHFHNSLSVSREPSSLRSDDLRFTPLQPRCTDARGSIIGHDRQQESNHLLSHVRLTILLHAALYDEITTSMKTERTGMWGNQFFRACCTTLRQMIIITAFVAPTHVPLKSLAPHIATRS